MRQTNTERHPVSQRRFIDPPHPASRFDSGNGNGTIRKSPRGKTLDHPILDGASESWHAEHDVENPWRGVDDPGLVVHPARQRRRKRRWFWE
ncbi:MAG: hypothetical protein ACK5LO_12845 [Leucobacter sp.]